ncbi:hypothetical protein CEXT_344051 [Caerostris extrusa]|uniref:Uncharacterized protein n=1 Tax=Caerostris extrusa TaxID=172846 RepID=A0AAV4YDA0_CAEEX|nr:hypothetical protein CEXT_344051 [Caerostris extrusa]
MGLKALWLWCPFPTHPRMIYFVALSNSRAVKALLSHSQIFILCTTGKISFTSSTSSSCNLSSIAYTCSTTSTRHLNSPPATNNPPVQPFNKPRQQNPLITAFSTLNPPAQQ